MISRYLRWVVLSALIGSQYSVASSWFDIKQRGVLRVGVAGDYAPLAFHNPQGKLTGFDIDMAHSLAEALHLDITFVATSWPTLSADLAADRFDIAVGGITETPARKNQFALSDPVMGNGKIALTQCDKMKRFTSMEAIDRAEVRVIVNPGGTNQDYVDKHIRQAHIIRAQDNYASLQGIRDRRADVMFTDQIEGNYYLHQEPNTFCISTPHILPGTASNKVYMVAKDNQELLGAVNTWLSGGTKDKLARQWQLAE